jgi:hypothetical protein
MNRLHSPRQKPFVEMDFVAVAIDKAGAHLALLYRIIAGGQIYMLDLAWDHILRMEPISSVHSDEYLWCGIPIDSMRAEVVANFFLEIYTANRDGIPYAFGDPMGAYGEDGKFIAANQRVGLTCASFVVSLLEKAGINLVDRRNWQKHWDDQRFFYWIIKALKEGDDRIPPAKRPDHWLAVAKQIANGAVRYKPTEIAGAATSPFYPVSFFEAFMLAGEIKAELPEGHKTPRHLILI